MLFKNINNIYNNTSNEFYHNVKYKMYILNIFVVQNIYTFRGKWANKIIYYMYVYILCTHISQMYTLNCNVK